jgi:DNA-binding NarL/FixJ family response regulator
MKDLNDDKSPITVAVVDDDANVREGMWWLLNNIVGMRCGGAYANCADAMEHLRDFSPDVLLLDVNLTETCGIDCIPEFRQRFPDAKIIMHSNFDDDEKIENSRRAGADGYVMKNTSAPQLYEAILSVCNGHGVWPDYGATNHYDRKSPQKQSRSWTLSQWADRFVSALRSAIKF